MQTELDFDAHARARKSDPQTSHEAAKQVTDSGAASAQREQCLAAVKLAQGMTAAELTKIIGCERHMPSRRLPELRRAGLVTSPEDRARVCRVTGNKSLTWWSA